jgi:hypothetical protein
MKKVLSLILSISILTSVSNAQTVLDVLKKALDNNAPNQQQKTLKTITIISTTKKLNGGARATFGGGFGAASRIQVPVNLPENTVDWYYSFTTTPASNNMQQTLRLASQITGIVSSLTPAGIARAFVSGLSQNAVQSLQVPSGSMAINAYLLDAQNVNTFINKQQFTYFENASSQQATQSIVRINDIKQGTYYIGLQNISSMSAVNITLEVVAIVAE